VRGWDATKIRVIKKRSGFWQDAGGMGWRIWIRERVKLDEQNNGVVGYVSVVSTSFSFFILHPSRHLHFVPSFLSCGIRRSWWERKFLQNLYVQSQSSTPLLLFYFQIPRAYNHHTSRIDHASVSCLFCTLAYAFHSHEHMKQLWFFLVHSIPGFSGLGASWARALFERFYRFTCTPHSN
jgi:hypothetical protein